MTEFVVHTPESMRDLGITLGRQLVAGDLVILTGALGAGKTTLTRGIGEGLGVRGPVTSPTFVIARTHPSLTGGPSLVHVDAYRLGGADELDDLDIDFDHSVVIVEWGAEMVRHGDSWMEIVLERPTGADAMPGAAQVGQPRGEEPGDEKADIDWSHAPVEPRTVTIAGHGPRWENGVRW